MNRTYFAALALLVLAAPARAETFVVSVDGADDNARDGKTAATAWKSLAFACDAVPAGAHTIQLESGTHAATRTAKPKDGVTVAGRGASGDKATKLVAATDWKLGDPTAIPHAANEFLIEVRKAKGVTVRDLAFESADAKSRISGAVFVSGTDGFTLKDARAREFRWAALYLEHSSGLKVERCEIVNGSTEKDKFHSGAIRTRWLKNSDIGHCRVIQTVGAEYGYKGGGHEGVRIHHCYFEQLGEFSFESAHENEYGLEIDHCHLNRCISVPKSGQGDDPNKRKFEFSVRIHHNLLTDRYTVEGPRNHLRFDHNYVRIEKTGGRVYSQHGGENQGPVWIHHNVVENLDRAFVWKNRGTAAKIHVFNNTVFCADAKDRAAAIVDTYSGDQIDGWQVKNNVFVCPESQPRSLYQDKGGAGKKMAFAANLCVNVKNPPDGSITDAAPGFALKGDKPFPHFVPRADAAVVGRGVDVGLPFKGKAPTIGALEAGEKNWLTDIPTKERK